MLPIRLPRKQVDDLFQRAARHAPLPADRRPRVPHDHRRARAVAAEFDVDPFRRHCLLNGLDDIGLTLEHEDKITAYEAAHGLAS